MYKNLMHSKFISISRYLFTSMQIQGLSCVWVTGPTVTAVWKGRHSLVRDMQSHKCGICPRYWDEHEEKRTNLKYFESLKKITKHITSLMTDCSDNCDTKLWQMSN